MKSVYMALAVTLSAGTAGASDLASAAFIYDYGVAQESVSSQEHVMCDSCKKDKLSPAAAKPNPLSLKFSEQPMILVSALPEAPVTIPAAKSVPEQLGTVFFGLNKYILVKKQQERLIGIATTIKKRLGNGAKVKVAGYTCELGSKKWNDSLAKKRAKNVAAFLKKQGVPLVEAGGTGECCFESKADRKLNRRAEVTLWSVPNE